MIPPELLISNHLLKGNIMKDETGRDMQQDRAAQHEEGHDDHSHHDDAQPHQEPVTIEVNGREVTLQGGTATGFEIKDAAIKQGVSIQPNFVLQQELPNGSSEVIGDTDVVRLHPHLKFTAIAPDDNS
jgi:hypothetical protein